MSSLTTYCWRRQLTAQQRRQSADFCLILRWHLRGRLEGFGRAARVHGAQAPTTIAFEVGDEFPGLDDLFGRHPGPVRS